MRSTGEEYSSSLRLLCVTTERCSVRGALDAPHYILQPTARCFARQASCHGCFLRNRHLLAVARSVSYGRSESVRARTKEIEAAINAAERDVDEMAYDLLAKEQPMAIDLRFILSVIKINGDLERIGDQATNIASRTQFLQDSPKISLPIDIPDMGEEGWGNDPARGSVALRVRMRGWRSRCLRWTTRSTI